MHAENIRISAGHYVGGLVGWSEGNVGDSCSAGGVTCGDFVGGLVGDNGGSVKNPYSSANVTGNEAIGGLVGLNYLGIVSSCYSDGSVGGG